MARILIAEDEPRITEFLEKGLRSAGYTTVAVDDGELAAALAAEHAAESYLLTLDVRDVGVVSRVVGDLPDELARGEEEPECSCSPLLLWRELTTEDGQEHHIVDSQHDFQDRERCQCREALQSEELVHDCLPCNLFLDGSQETDTAS